jgi:hypothetical protein
VAKPKPLARVKTLARARLLARAKPLVRAKKLARAKLLRLKPLARVKLLARAKPLARVKTLARAKLLRLNPLARSRVNSLSVIPVAEHDFRKDGRFIVRLFSFHQTPSFCQTDPFSADIRNPKYKIPMNLWVPKAGTLPLK